MKGVPEVVYVLNKDGHPLMPTERHGKVRRMLRNGEAKVVRRCPFTIQLLYESEDKVQEITLGVDSGSRKIGLSATTDAKVLYEAEVELRNDIVELLATRRELRRSRRNRKTRYRKPRFNNRTRPEKWLAPSVSQKVQTHLTVVDKVCRILPISKIVIETASFDIQKIKNPQISGTEYQQGEQLDFWNVREYVLFRDGHICQCCKGKSKDVILNVHHIESRKTGGDAPNNLITLCETCHKKYHAGEIELPKTIMRGMKFQDTVFMGIMRWACYNELKTRYPNVSMTFGYVTKNTRIENGLPKTHYIDARCISKNPTAKPLGYFFCQKKVRCHNRQIHKLTINKGGIRKNNQAAFEVKGFRLNDVVLSKGKQWIIHGRRSKGAFVLTDLVGNKLEISPSKIKFVSHSNAFLTERMAAIPPRPIEVGVPLPKL